MRSMVEGACSVEACRESEALPPPFGRSPLPAARGGKKNGDT